VFDRGGRRYQHLAGHTELGSRVLTAVGHDFEASSPRQSPGPAGDEKLASVGEEGISAKGQTDLLPLARGSIAPSTSRL